MRSSWWAGLLPGWPRVPPRLWLTGAGIAVVIANLMFSQELWPHHPRAEAWSRALFVLLLQAGGAQAIAVLWQWPRAYGGPAWMRLLLRALATLANIGIAILLLVLLPLSCFYIWDLASRY